MQSLIKIVWLGFEIVSFSGGGVRLGVNLIYEARHRAPPPPRKRFCGAKKRDHPVEATVKFTSWLPLVFFCANVCTFTVPMRRSMLRTLPSLSQKLEF